MFQIEINKEWEKFFTFLRKRVRTFMKKHSTILIPQITWLFRFVLNYHLLTAIGSIWH